MRPKKAFRRILDGIILVWIVVFLSDRITPWYSNFDANVLLSKYTSEEIDHFANFALSNGKLGKWRKDIKIKVLDYGDREALTEELTMNCINLLNTLIEDIEIQIESDKYNLSVVFFDSMVNDRTGYAPTFESIFLIPYPTVKSGKIEIYVGDQNWETINSIIHHEFSHILGFHHYFMLEYQSVFNPEQKKLVVTNNSEEMVYSFENYSDLDKAAIRIMYDKDVGIDPGLTKEKFYRMIEKAKKEMGYDDPVVGGG